MPDRLTPEVVTEIIEAIHDSQDKENINKQRFEAVEARVKQLEEFSNRNYQAVLAGNKDTAEVLDWIKNIKTGARWSSRFMNFLGRLIIFIGKYAAGAAVVYALYETIRYGKEFHINLPPPE